MTEKTLMAAVARAQSMPKEEILAKLDRIESAMRYTQATVAPGNLGQRDGEWAPVHFGRASSSERQLASALDDLAAIRRELQNG